MSRIPTATLPSTYANGQILTGAEVNKIVTILREGVNYNKEDLDRFAGTSVFQTEAAAIAYASSHTLDEGTRCIVIEGGTNEVASVYKITLGQFVFEAEATLTSIFEMLNSFGDGSDIYYGETAPEGEISTGALWISVDEEGE